MARQAPTLVSGQTLLESTAIFLAALLVLVAYAIRSDAGTACAVPPRVAPERQALASGDPAPETLFRDALLLGD